ncbi:lipid-binding SYLF domain-containing protein [Aequorivita echinoideorum]|uniref:Lipid-binding SYLF domain-containing protein n=1 Tax=Aequorivita echinoideorum TaxID=1549647 RepID=A0ABS5S570_9FLAO|nr:lipid-binding SYLF domain-containing protein [Aequorivita echinoideorum]MBT0607000.1 lipid-binding SYLF domain-containing protein [Aequorivita echinoideorum]
MKLTKIFTLVVLFIGTTLIAQNSDDKKVIKDAEMVKAEMIKTNKKIQTYFDDAKAYVIFPNVGKGALIVGAASGNGAVYERGTLVGMAKMKQLDIGAQIGGEAYGEVIFFKTDAALQEFMDDDLEFTGQVSAVAVKEDATLNVKYNDGVAVFTMPKGGLMAEVSVGGQKFDYTAFE